jgi:hypothetical protein
VQALTGVIPLGRKDPVQRLLAFGLPDMSKDIVREVSTHRASAVLTTDYAMTAWLRFYLPADLPVIQVDEPFRWTTSPDASAETFKHPLIYVENARHDRPEAVKRQFASVVPCGTISRGRWSSVIETYTAYCVRHPTKAAAGKVP